MLRKNTVLFIAVIAAFAALFAVTPFNMDSGPTVVEAGCNAGTFPDGNGGCDPCPTGTFCPDGSAAVDCPVGTFCDQMAMTIATPCLVGFYCPTTGASFAIQCPAGTTSPEGAASIDQCIDPSGVSPATLFIDPTGDPDTDGVPNAEDNCPGAPNPDQADFWGSDLGNACDNSDYDTGNGAVIFPQKDGDIRVYGNCKVPAGATNAECVIIAETDAADLAALALGEFARFETPEGEGHFVDVYLLAEDANGNRTFQVYVYEPGGNLLDNSYTFIVSPAR